MPREVDRGQRKNIRRRVLSAMCANAPEGSIQVGLLQGVHGGWGGESQAGRVGRDGYPGEPHGVFFPAEDRLRLRTTYGLEHINRELRQRARVASIFPDPASEPCPVSAVSHLGPTRQVGAHGPKVHRHFIFRQQNPVHLHFCETTRRYISSRTQKTKKKLMFTMCSGFYWAFLDGGLVERKGIEPSTFALRTRRSPS